MPSRMGRVQTGKEEAIAADSKMQGPECEEAAMASGLRDSLDPERTFWH